MFQAKYLKSKIIIAIAVLFVCAIAFFFIFSDDNSSLMPENIPQDTEIKSTETPFQEETQEAEIQQQAEIFYPVVKVIDGDTLSIDMNGNIQIVRLIGLDTPETVHPSEPVECFGQEASNKAKQVLTNQKVRLEQDATQGVYDKYGRFLAYIYLEDGTLFNKMMIEEGYGFEYTYIIPHKYQSDFQSAENQARTLKKGLWADGVCDVEKIFQQ